MGCDFGCSEVDLVPEFETPQTSCHRDLLFARNSINQDINYENRIDSIFQDGVYCVP
jgi:hypothetical protein